MFFCQTIDNIALIIHWSVVGARCAKEGRLALDPILSVAILSAFDRKAVGDFNLEHLDAGLFHGQVGHLNIQTMEVDTIETLIDSLGEFALANFLYSNGVVQSAELVELSEQVVELGECARVFGVGGPEAAWHGSVPGLKLVNDLVEVPREGQHIGVLLLGEFCVHTESCILRGKVDLATTLLLLWNDRGVWEAAHAYLGESKVRAQLVPLERTHVKSLVGDADSKERHTCAET